MSTATTPPPVNVGDQGIRALGLGLTWALTLIAIMAVATRFHLRWKFSRKLNIDDWIMLVALMLQITYQIGGFTMMGVWGNGIPGDQLSKTQQMMINKYSWTFAVPGFLVSILARISIAIVLIRLFGVKAWFYWYMVIFTTIQTIVGIISVILILVMVRPFQGLWDKSIQSVQINRAIYNWTAMALQYFFMISDLTYVLFPVLIIWKLHMTTRRKLGLLALLGMSLITMGAAVAKITVAMIPMTNSNALGDPNAKYFTGIINLTSDCEQCLVIIMGCVPTLHLVTRLKLTFLHRLSSSLSSLMSRRKGKGEDTNNSSVYSGGAAFHNVELAPKLRVSDDDYSTNKGSRDGPIITSPLGDSDQNLWTNGQIQRTDSYTVTYKPQARPKEDV